ncbi:Zn-ribbon-containing protein [Anaerovibrio sp. JC8]|uniref:DUF721 domain-containing protein n=1 Tax=Anaerovibrio sp. JC8 TaxID=1240085 RepID=UPI000A0B3110|nr:DUF721 domain-containing protein [Anaerovibrio sp. JC8]ORU01136.1 Zn-ribbon-containing protein [Anaerovibrio sp. JC8]
MSAPGKGKVDKKNIIKKGKLEKLNIILPQIVKSMSIGREFSSHMLMYYWPRIVGQHISENVSPVKLEFKKLFLYTSHPIWATQLSYMKDELKDKINSFMGEYLVEDLIFTNIKPEKIDFEENENEVNLGREIRKINITDDELDEISNDLAEVKDDDLRRLLLKVKINDAKLKKYRRQSNWHPCSRCQTLCPPEEQLCDGCRRLANEERLDSIRKYLVDVPWARFCDIVKDIPCTADEVNEQRIILMKLLASKINANNTDCMEVTLLTMLYKSVSPDKLTPELREQTIKKFRYDFIGSFSPSKGSKYHKNIQKKV